MSDNCTTRIANLLTRLDNYKSPSFNSSLFLEDYKYVIDKCFTNKTAKHCNIVNDRISFRNDIYYKKEESDYINKRYDEFEAHDRCDEYDQLCVNNNHKLFRKELLRNIGFPSY